MTSSFPTAPHQTLATVLVVDDEPAVRRLMAAALRGCFRVLEAGSGREALQLIERDGVEVAAVVTDVRMPDGDGLSLARALGQHRQPPAILFVSGFVGGAELPAPFIAKPFLPSDLVAAVHNLLAGVADHAGPV